jgi:hypothetical protein
MAEMQWPAAMFATVVTEQQLAARDAEQEVRSLSRHDEIELLRIEGYDKHDW